jgi:hypothetical protein
VWLYVVADTLGFDRYAPPYLSPQASGENLLVGANFASAASSYLDDTAAMYVSTRPLPCVCWFSDPLHIPDHQNYHQNAYVTLAGRDHADPAAGVLQGVPVQACRGGRPSPGSRHPLRRAVRRQHRHRRLPPELLPKRVPVPSLRRRPLLRPPRRYILRLRQRAVRARGAAGRGDVHAAAGLPAGVNQPVPRQGPRRVRAQAQPRRRDVQPEAERHGRGGQDAARRPQARHLRHLQAAPGPHRSAGGARYALVQLSWTAACRHAGQRSSRRR